MSRITVVEDKIFIIHVRILIEMVNPIVIEQRAAAFDAVYNIKQEFGEMSGNTGDKGDFRHYNNRF